jgi:hypothetical protein
MQPSRAHARVPIVVAPEHVPSFRPSSSRGSRGKTERCENRLRGRSLRRCCCVFSAGSGPQVHVARRGSMSLQNALRPLSNATPAVVLQVTISGKVARSRA